jgi:hypothetical protein
MSQQSVGTDSRLDPSSGSVLPDKRSYARLPTISGSRSAGNQAFSVFRTRVPSKVHQDLERVTRGSLFLSWASMVATAAVYISVKTRTATVAFAAPARNGFVSDLPCAVFPMVVTVGEDLTFREYLDGNRLVLSRMYSKKPLSSEEIRQSSSYENTSERPFQVGISFADFQLALPPEAADIRIEFQGGPGDLDVDVAFDGSCFSFDSVRDLVDGQLGILARGLEDPNQRLPQLALRHAAHGGAPG